MVSKIFCDKCGKEISDFLHMKKIVFQKDGTGLRDISLEYCFKCFDETLEKCGIKK